MIKNGPVVSEKNKFQFSYVNELGPRSRNDLDFQCSHTFINSLSCHHLLALMSQAAIVSEKSIVFHTEKPKLPNLTCRKMGQGQPRVIV